MLAKATLRIPAPLLARLRERSRTEGRSLNETALRALERGLGGNADGEGWSILGSVIEAVPAKRYDPEEFRALRARLGPRVKGLQEDLDWVRGEV